MKKFLALVLALVMTMSLVTVGASAKTEFTDDAAITEVEAVEVLSQMGVIAGYTDGSFKPQANLNRAAGAKFIAYLMLGQKAADGLVASGTAFEDVPADYLLAPYVEWCAKMGIVDGYGNGKFGPKDTLKQSAFGKMLLTALGYSSEKEGFTGAGWQKAVYALGLAAGVYGADGEIYADCNRETAAKMALGALKADLVTYKTITESVSTTSAAGVTTTTQYTANGAVATGKKLWENYTGLSYVVDADKYGRPGHTWGYTKTSFSKFYMDTPVAEYTTKVSECDILKAFGIPETKATVLSFNVQTAAGAVDKTGNCWYEDGYLWKGQNTDPYVTLHHDDKKVCQATNGKDSGQGVLTQLFKVGTKYVVTEINTYLAKVGAAHAATHNTAAYNDLEMYCNVGGGKYETTVKAGFNKGDYVLVTGVWADAPLADVQLDGKVMAKFTVDTAVLADSVVAKLTGATNTTTQFDGTYYNDAALFKAGYYTAHNYANNGKQYTVYFDTYGNVIGCVDYKAAAQYVVIDGIGFENTYLAKTYYADLVGMDAAAVATKGVVNYGESFFGTFKPKNSKRFVPYTLDENNNAFTADDIYTYVVDAKGANVLTLAAKATERDCVYTSATGKLNVSGNTVAYLDNETIVLAKDLNGEYKSYTGWKNVPDLYAATYAVVELNDDGNETADLVYLTGVYYAADSVTGFVFFNQFRGTFNWAGDYELVTVWVNGEAKVVNFKKDDANLQSMLSAARDTRYTGMFLTYKSSVDKFGNVVVESVDTSAANSFETVGQYGLGNGTLLTNKGYYDLGSVALYKINELTFEVSAIAADDTMVTGSLGQSIYVQKDNSGKAVALYFYTNDGVYNK